MRFVKKKTVAVALKCQACKGISEYPLSCFPRSVYKRHGYIMQWCGCSEDRRGSDSNADSLGNTRHKIAGVFLEQQLPVSTAAAKELLGSLVS